MTDRTLLDRKEVAIRLGHTLNWFYNNLSKLQQDRSFPSPVLGNKHGARWDPRAIDRWLDAQDPARAAAVTAPAAVNAELDEETAELMRRALELPANGVRRRSA